MLAPSQIERPFTNNPVIPLLDCVYDHVIKRYPKRAFCILRNCVKVSDLLRATQVIVRRQTNQNDLSSAGNRF